jgi:hypothetical protein
MSRTPIALIARDWYRPGAKTRPKRATPPVPRVIERLRRMLVWDEQRRARLGTWPPPITLPKLGRNPPTL